MYGTITLDVIASVTMIFMIALLLNKIACRLYFGEEKGEEIEERT